VFQQLTKRSLKAYLRELPAGHPIQVSLQHLGYLSKRIISSKQLLHESHALGVSERQRVGIRIVTFEML
jgi:hypothetical protein